MTCLSADGKASTTTPKAKGDAARLVASVMTVTFVAVVSFLL